VGGYFTLSFNTAPTFVSPVLTCTKGCEIGASPTMTAWSTTLYAIAALSTTKIVPGGTLLEF